MVVSNMNQLTNSSQERNDTNTVLETVGIFSAGESIGSWRPIPDRGLRFWGEVLAGDNATNMRRFFGAIRRDL
jgi:hypothetical protein